MRRSAVTTPVLLDRFEGLNRKKPYPNRVKPFNFLLSPTVSPLETPCELFELDGIPSSWPLFA